MNWFWHAIWIAFVIIPAVLLWIFCLVDVFMRRDLTGLAKTTWVVLVLLIPWFGALIYLIVRPDHANSLGPQAAH
jgi:hypothetical protein